MPTASLHIVTGSGSVCAPITIWGVFEIGEFGLGIFEFWISECLDLGLCQTPAEGLRILEFEKTGFCDYGDFLNFGNLEIGIFEVGIWYFGFGVVS